MSLDGLAAVQARIAEIQKRFVAAPQQAAGAEAAGSGGDGQSFAALLSMAGGSDADGLSGMLGDLAGSANSATALKGTGALIDPGFGGVAAPGSRVQGFLKDALAQAGDAYVWGASASPTDANPAAFDCSELVRWAAKRQGVDVPDGSWLQYLRLKQQGMLIPVEQGVRTPGALLFSFSEEPRPGGARPSQAHVAISLGDGRTIEARGRKYGVGTWETGNRFEFAALIPGLSS